MFTKQPTMDMDIEFDIKLLATEYYEGTVCIRTMKILSILFFFFFFCWFVLMLILHPIKYYKNQIESEKNTENPQYRFPNVLFIEFIVVELLLLLLMQFQIAFQCEDSWDDCQSERWKEMVSILIDLVWEK